MVRSASAETAACLELFAAPRSIVAAARQHAADFPDADTGLTCLLFRRGVRADHARIARAASVGVPYAVGGGRAVGTLSRPGRGHPGQPVRPRAAGARGAGFAHVGERYVAAVRRELTTRSFARANHDVQVRLSPIA